MFVFRRVTGEAGLRRTFEYAVDMTCLALDSCVSAGQREGSLAVVKTDVLPRSCVMAGAAIFAELALVRIFCGVTGEAGLWRALEFSIDMTRGAGDFGVAAV